MEFHDRLDGISRRTVWEIDPKLNFAPAGWLSLPPTYPDRTLPFAPSLSFFPSSFFFCSTRAQLSFYPHPSRPNRTCALTPPPRLRRPFSPPGKRMPLPSPSPPSLSLHSFSSSSSFRREQSQSQEDHLSEKKGGWRRDGKRRGGGKEGGKQRRHRHRNRMSPSGGASGERRKTAWMMRRLLSFPFFPPPFPQDIIHSTAAAPFSNQDVPGLLPVLLSGRRTQIPVHNTY